MAFGKPDILDPKFELRPIQAAIRAARQRIEVLEAAITVLQNVSTGTQSINTLQAQVASLLALLSNVQNANTVFAGPTSGTATQAQFRALEWSDLPLVSDLPFSSGVEADALVAIELDGTMVYITLGELMATGGVTVHGLLTGLAADDHLQYHNDARGDARYSLLGHTHVAADVTDFDTQVRTSRLDQMAAPSASVDFADQQALSFRLENLTGDPGSPATGQIWLRTDL